MSKIYSSAGMFENMTTDEPIHAPADKVEEAERKLVGDCQYCGVGPKSNLIGHHYKCLARIKEFSVIKKRVEARSQKNHFCNP